MATMLVLLFISGFPLTSGFDSEIISDIVSPIADERRALDIKSQQFWGEIQHSSLDTKNVNHNAVYAEIEAAIAALPADNRHVHTLMSDALMRLRRADAAVLQQAVESSDLASDRLTTGGVSESVFSFMTGGQNFLSLAIKRFVGGSDYGDRISTQVASRQGDILPALRGAASITPSVLDDCRMASKLSFDVLKYDIYNSGVPKTPEDTKTAANRLVDASGQTRHHFMQGITDIASALTKDTEEKDVNPSAKVTQTLLSDMHSKWGEDRNVHVSHEEALIIDF